MALSLLTKSDYAEAVAFELYVLESDQKHPMRDDGTVLDFRSKAGVSMRSTVTMFDNMNLAEYEVGRVLEKFAPLMFGAAWKALDLLLELALNRACRQTNRWSIKEKRACAKAGEGDHLVLTHSKPLWDLLLKLYDVTVEHRHCLVHRTAKINSATGAFEGKFEDGRPIKVLTFGEQIAIIKIAGIVAQAAIQGRLDSREEFRLRYHFDQVAVHTGAPLFSVAGRLSSPMVVLLKLDGKDGVLILDMADVTDQLQKIKEHLSINHFDFLIDMPGESERKLFGRAEDFPLGRSTIDLDSLPDWLSFR